MNVKRNDEKKDIRKIGNKRIFISTINNSEVILCNFFVSIFPLPFHQKDFWINFSTFYVSKILNQRIHSNPEIKLTYKFFSHL